jgi:hypothetical protein
MTCVRTGFAWRFRFSSSELAIVIAVVKSARFAIPDFASVRTNAIGSEGTSPRSNA